MCFVFTNALSNINTIAGNTVTQAITPNTTPFAITTPISSPNVNVIKQRAINPATVVIELPTIDETVAVMAFAMALLLSFGITFFCSS